MNIINLSKKKKKKKSETETGELPWRLRALVVFAKNLGLVFRMYLAAHSHP